jgi:4'-phosphopantetheinyl transferase
MAARMSLRRILGSQTCIAPQDLVFEEAENRKPRLVLPPGATPVYFNVSHSGDYAVIAVSTEAEVGIDIEEIRTDCPVDDLSRRYYSAREHAWLRSLQPPERLEAFYRLWTIKEAVLKCAGLGLSVPPQVVEVHLAKSGAPSITSRDESRKSLEQLQVRELQVTAGYAGSLAVAAYTDIRVVVEAP